MQDGNFAALSVKDGDKVLYKHIVGNKVEVDGEELQLCREADIVGVVEKAPSVGTDDRGPMLNIAGLDYATLECPCGATSPEKSDFTAFYREHHDHTNGYTKFLGDGEPYTRPTSPSYFE